MAARRRSHRRVGRAGAPVLLVAPVVVALAWAGLAYACVPQPRLVTVAPRSSGPAGGQVTVDGIGFDPPPSRVEIRWNSADGALLGTADQGDFSVPVTIPAAEPGLYGILVISRGADGVLGNTGRATFQVTGEPLPPGAPVATTTPPVTFAAAPTVIDTGPPAVALAAWSVALVLVGLALGHYLPGPRRRPTGAPPGDLPAGGPSAGPAAGPRPGERG